MSAPTAPLIDIRPEVGFSSILFYWRPPTSDGGSPVLYYTLACPAISFSANISTTADTYLVDNLARTTDFTFTMTATNANGTGPAATYRTVQTGLIPFGPTQATASTLTNTIAYLTWNLSTLATNEATPKWFVVTITPSTPTLSSFKRCAYIYERAKTFTVPSTNIFYQFLVQAVSDPGYCVPFAFTSTLGFGITGGGGGAFSPSSFAGLSFWLDATQISGASNNQALTAWNDLSPNAYPGGASNGPRYITSGINSLPIVRFNGTDQYVNYGPSSLNIRTNPFHTFIVAKYSTTNTTGCLMAKSLFGGANPRYFFGKLDTTSNQIYFNDPANIRDIFYTFNSASTSMFGTYWDRNTLFASLNGSTLSTAAFSTSFDYNSAFSLLVGAYNNGTGGVPPGGFFFPGDMGEIVSYLSPLTPFDRQKVEGYLAWKWGLQTSLPASHPFRTALPLTTSVFSPSSFSSLMLWMDAADSSSMTVSSGVVTAWSDKSGRGNSATTITGTPLFSNTAIGTRSAIWMNGTNTSFQGSYVNMGTTLTAFTVATLSNTSQVNGRLLVVGQSNLNDYDGGPGALVFLRLNSTLGTYRSNTMRTAFPEIYNTPFMMRTTFTGTTISTVFNGTGVSTAAFSGSFSTLHYNIGYKFGPFSATAEYWGGYVGETLIYNNALSTEDCQTIEGYLAWKWGLQGNLPTTHPYRNQNPASLSNPTPYFATNFNSGNDAGFVNYATSNLSTQTQTGTGFSYRPNSSIQMYKESLTTSTNTVSFCASLYRTSSTGFAAVMLSRNPIACGFILSSNGTNFSYLWNDLQNTYEYTSPYVIPLNTWIHTVLTISPTEARWYVNGALVDTYSNAHTPAAFSNMRIGIDPQLTLSNRFFPGLIDNVAFYATTLTSSQVYSIYASTLAPTVVQSSLQLFLDATSYAGSGTWYDQSPFGRHAGLENGTRAKNAIGNGVVFNGATNFLTTGSVMSTMNNWTASFWFKRTSSILGTGVFQNGANACIVTEVFGPAINLSIPVSGSNDSVPGGVSSFTCMFLDRVTPAYRSYSPAYETTLNQWVNGTYTYDGTNMRFYVNGSLSGTTNIGVSSSGGSNVYRIGRRWDLANYVIGEIGQVLIYNRALSAAEIGSNYNAYSTVFSV